jgi:hypothetical protein
MSVGWKTWFVTGVAASFAVVASQPAPRLLRRNLVQDVRPAHPRSEEEDDDIAAQKHARELDYEKAHGELYGSYRYGLVGSVPGYSNLYTSLLYRGDSFCFSVTSEPSPMPFPVFSMSAGHSMPDGLSFPTMQPTNFFSFTEFPTLSPFSFVDCVPASTSFSFHSVQAFSFPELELSLGNLPTTYGSCAGDPVFFEPLGADDDGVTRLFLDDDEVQQISMPFDFSWMGGLRVIREGDPIGVGSNGQINLLPDDFDHVCCRAIPIGSYNKPRIALAQENLNPGWTWLPGGPGVYIKSSPSSLIVSFQEIPWYPSVPGVQVQAELFPDGRVSICWGGGDGAGISFASGLEDGENNTLVFPVNNSLAGFSEDGLNMLWPTCSCFCFDPNRDVPYVPSAAPSHEVPSDMPSGAPYVKEFLCPSSYEPLDSWMDDVTEVFLGDDNVAIYRWPFDFNWLGQQILPAGSSFGISSNGQINVKGDTSSNCCLAIPVNGSYGIPRVAFAQEDLNPPRGGNIFLRTLPDSVVVSFQNIRWFVEDFGINAQVQMFQTGEISICYGTGSTARNSFAAGIEDFSLGIAIPVTNVSVGFDSRGITSGWPANFCFCFEPNRYFTNAPSFSPTASPMPTTTTIQYLSCPSATSFQPLYSGMSGVMTLNLGDDEVAYSTLPFDFNWLNREVIPLGRIFGISSNGQINIRGTRENGCCSAIPVNGSYSGGARIAFVQEDLNPNTGGNVLLKRTNSSITVSFQDIRWYINDWGVNAQVTIFPDGQVNLCYGTGNTAGNSFAAGLEDKALGLAYAVSDPSSGFNVDGVTNQWPANKCFCFLLS